MQREKLFLSPQKTRPVTGNNWQRYHWVHLKKELSNDWSCPQSEKGSLSKKGYSLLRSWLSAQMVAKLRGLWHSLVVMLVRCRLWSHLGKWCYALPIIKCHGEYWESLGSSTLSPCQFLTSKQKVPKAIWDMWLWVCGCDGWGLGNEETKTIWLALLVSDKKPNETVSSKIKSVLAPNQASQNEWNWVQHG